MALYNDLSSIYDIIFPENKAATEFLSSNLKVQTHILDIACGTGNYSIALAEQGHDVTGIDLDAAMIEAAQRKASGRTVSFATGNMLEIDRMFHGRRFGLIYCIGNSLVHLPDKDSVSEFARKVYALLEPQGTCLIQIVNYDRIVKYHIESLPTIEKKDAGVTFTRNYVFSDNHDYIEFCTEINSNGDKLTNSVRLLALQSADLVSILRSAGFGEIQLLGGYDGSVHSDESMATIVKADM